MTIPEKIDLLKSLPLFKNLSQQELEVIAGAASEQTIPAGTVFIEQEDESNSAYLIYKGSARVFRITEDGNEVNVAIIGPGEVVGELALLDNQPRSACVEALQEVKLLMITKSEFSNILKKYPDTAVSLLCTLADRVRSSNQLLEDVLSKNLYSRTWQTLNSLSHFFPGRVITLSQEELACIVGATRSRVTEILNELQTEKKITLAHRQIHLLEH